MSKFWSEFKEFAMKGNVVDMAVGVVIGGAFGKIVTSLVSDVLMPVVGALCGGVNFTDWKWVLSQAVTDPATGEVVKEAVSINYGNLIQVIIDFILIALCIFCVIKAINKAKSLTEKKEEAPEEPAAKPDDVVLLEEIRDLLKERK